MNKLWLGAVLAATAMTVQAFADTVTSVNVVGYVNLTVYGGVADTYTLIAAPMTKVPVARGTISGNTTNTITDSSAAWAVNTFAAGTTNLAVQPGASTYYVEVTSGTFEGRHFYIASNSGNVLTLAAAMGDINVGNLVGATYKVIPANRVRDIFGEPGSPALTSGSSASTADTVRIMNSAGWGSAIFYRTGSLFPPNNTWVRDNVDVSNLVVDRDIGLLVLRRAGRSTLELTVVGEVSANTQSSVVVPGFSLVGGMSAVSVPIGQSGLTNVLKTGNSATTADTIRSWTGAGWSSPVFYRVGSLFPPNNTWVRDNVDVSSTFMIEPGVAYLINKSGVQSGVWERSSPLE